MMNGIDISGHQQGIDLAAVPCDFVIIKATQGISFVNPDFKRQIAQALSLNKLVGVYHYATAANISQQVEHFVETILPYFGKVIIALDWEKDDNKKFGDYKFCEDLLEAIKDRTGKIPFLYMSKSVARQYKWERGRYYPFWCAQYKKLAPRTYVDNPWTDDKGWGAWSGCAIHQYSSRGRLDGFKNDLDLDICYLTADEWNCYATGEVSIEPAQQPILRYGDRNDYVKAWQQYLTASGFPCGNPDGVFGDKTLRALCRYQQAHGMESGIIGAQTWATLPC